MPRLVVTERAAQGLERCHQFLININSQAAIRAGKSIAHHLLLLENNPEIGSPFDDASELRELILEFGDSGYIGLYRYKEVSYWFIQ